jgi:hypothetical protein
LPNASLSRAKAKTAISTSFLLAHEYSLHNGYHSRILSVVDLSVFIVTRAKKAVWVLFGSYSSRAHLLVALFLYALGYTYSVFAIEEYH